jgi:hypothetical protein
VQQIAENPAFDTGPTKLEDSDIQGWFCSDHITYPAFPADWNALAVATDTETKPTCGTDPHTKEIACGQAYVLLAGAGIVTSSELVLTPPKAVNPVGGEHTVTATLTETKENPITKEKETKPVVGAVITFVVTGQNSGAEGTCTTTKGAADPKCETDETGGVRFTYKDTKGAGEDTIHASTKVGETTDSATASKTWTAPTGCAISDKKASPFTDVKTGKTVLAEDNLASIITPISPGNSAPENLVVRGNGRFFALTGLTSVKCHDNTEYPLDAGNAFNTVSGDGPGTLGTAFGNGKPGYTAHWEFSDRGDQLGGSDTGGDSINLIVYNGLGHVVWHVNGKFAEPVQEETG